MTEPASFALPDPAPLHPGAAVAAVLPPPPGAPDPHPGDMSVALVAVDASGLVTFANAAFLALFGGDPEGTLAGRPFADCVPSSVGPEAVAARPGGAREALTAAGVRHDLFWAWTGPGGWIGTIRLPEPRDPLPDLVPVRTDALTGLADRASLRPAFDALARAAARGAAQASSPIMAACFDLDRFKRVNDSRGHAAGDDLLRKVAGRLRASVRRSDVVIRMGGDEFTILFSNCTPAEIEEMALRIIEVVSRPFIVQGHQIIIGTSVGLAMLAPGETDPVELLRRADVALYRSKKAGRGCIHWFEQGMFAALEERRLLEKDLRMALLLEQFELAYQSQLDFRTESILVFEALIRWRHPVRGLVSPANFVPIAEETGMILKIGAWVLEEACRTAMSWPDHLSVAVNVSPVQFEAEGFVESVLAALAASGLPPRRLELELTESVLITNDEIVLDRMRALREVGVRLSLDDFGTGYSSLNYLRKYPFDKVKIDQSFVREPFADANAHRIVTAVAGLGTSMGMTVIAEGVETEEQMARIRRQGCSAAQGYLLSRPIAGPDIAAYLAAGLRAPTSAVTESSREPRP